MGDYIGPIWLKPGPKNKEAVVFAWPAKKTKKWKVIREQYKDITLLAFINVHTII